jgi:hypothetical protein
VPTTLNSFIASEFRMGFREKFVTEGLNQKMAAVMPPGVYRGFKLGPTATVNAVSIDPDPSALDNIALFETATGFSLTLTKQGSYEVDVSSFVDAGNEVEVVIAILGTYVIGDVTTAVVKGYELSPIDEYTADPDVNELVVLGTVIIPTNSVAAIPAANITSDKRTMAWRNTAPEAIIWQPVIKNAHFEYGRDEAGGGYPQYANTFWESSDNSGSPWTHQDFGDAPQGNYTATLLLNTGPYSETLTQQVGVEVLEGQRMLVEIQKKVYLGATGGTGNFNAYFKDVDGVELGALSVPYGIDTIDASFVKVVAVLEGPTDSALLDRVEFDMDSVTYTSGKGTGLAIGSAQLWVDTPSLDPVVAGERYGELIDVSRILIRSDDPTVGTSSPTALLTYSEDPTGNRLVLGSTNSSGPPAYGIIPTGSFHLIFESKPAGLAKGYRRYFDATNGRTIEAVNALYSGGWQKDVDGETAFAVVTGPEGIEHRWQEPTDNTWSDSQWTRIATVLGTFSSYAENGFPMGNTTRYDLGFTEFTDTIAGDYPWALLENAGGNATLSEDEISPPPRFHASRVPFYDASSNDTVDDAVWIQHASEATSDGLIFVSEDLVATFQFTILLNGVAVSNQNYIFGLCQNTGNIFTTPTTPSDTEAVYFRWIGSTQTMEIVVNDDLTGELAISTSAPTAGVPQRWRIDLFGANTPGGARVLFSLDNSLLSTRTVQIPPALIDAASDPHHLTPFAGAYCTSTTPSGEDEDMYVVDIRYEFGLYDDTDKAPF